MTRYLDPRVDDPALCFKDLPIMKKPDGYFQDSIFCPLCQGHGGWNLVLDQYKAYEPPNCHFRAHCNQCNGWGYVSKGSIHETCIHECRELSSEECNKKNIRHYGMCWHVYECTKCGYIYSQDSSD